MIFSGLELMKEKPFSQVYIHPTVFNKEGKRMSKSLGTGVDPLLLIDKYGADATRFGLMYINTGTQDLKFDELLIINKKFANKVWNIARFTMMQIDNMVIASNSEAISNNDWIAASPSASRNDKLAPKTEADKQILSRLNEVIKSTDENLDNFRFGQAAHDLYDFVWHDFADIYIEASKNQVDTPELKENTLYILLYTLKTTLKLLHPFMPFVTEKIWQNLKENGLVNEEQLITAHWPK